MDDEAPTRTFAGNAVASRVLSQMLLSADALSDLLVHVGAATFSCHRAVLAASSPVFHAMFLSDMKEQLSGHLSLPDVVPASVFAAVREYMYGRPLHVVEADAVALSDFVRQYEIGLPELSDFFDNLLASALTLDNMLHIRRHADSHSSHRLRRSCDRFITVRMHKLPETPSFLESSSSDAETALLAPNFVSRDSISRRCAQHVLTAAMAWIRHDESRTEFLDRILNTVHLDGMSLPALVRASREELAVRSQPFQRRLLRAFASRAERDLAFGSLRSPPAGFAVVDDSDYLRRAHRLDLLEGMPSSLYHGRRRSSLSVPFVHSRFPRDSARLPPRTLRRSEMSPSGAQDSEETSPQLNASGSELGTFG